MQYIIIYYYHTFILYGFEIKYKNTTNCIPKYSILIISHCKIRKSLSHLAPLCAVRCAGTRSQNGPEDEIRRAQLSPQRPSVRFYQRKMHLKIGQQLGRQLLLLLLLLLPLALPARVSRPAEINLEQLQRLGLGNVVNLPHYTDRKSLYQHTLNCPH